METRRDVYQAIADPIRRDILTLLTKESLNLNSIAGNFDISRPAISQHIKILEECGLVIITKKGRERFCQIQPAQLIEVQNWMEPFKKMWEVRLDSFETYLDKMQKKK